MAESRRAGETKGKAATPGQRLQGQGSGAEYRDAAQVCTGTRSAGPELGKE